MCCSHTCLWSKEGRRRQEHAPGPGVSSVVSAASPRSPVVSRFTDNIYEKVKNKTKQDLKEKWVSLYKMLCAAKVNVSPHPCDDILTTKASGRLTNVPGFSPSSPKDAVSNKALQWTLKEMGMVCGVKRE